MSVSPSLSNNVSNVYSVVTYSAIGEEGLQFRKNLSPFEMHVAGDPQLLQIAKSRTIYSKNMINKTKLECTLISIN